MAIKEDFKPVYSREWAVEKDEGFDYGKIKAELLRKLTDALDEINPDLYVSIKLRVDADSYNHDW